MSYSINGKIYTDNALMDEIVYNTKIILHGIVVKNEIQALEYETETSLEDADWFRLAHEGIYPFDLFPFTYEMLAAYTWKEGAEDKHFTDEQILSFLDDRYNIPEDMRDSVYAFCQQYYCEDFAAHKEMNKYYRGLMGQPPYILGDDGTESKEYWIYLDPSWIPPEYDLTINPIEFDVPIHQQPIEVINLLYQAGIIDKLIEEYRSTNYSYLRFLGSKKIDLYTARMANRWDILYMPTVNSLVQSRFQELYNVNKEMFNRRFYQEAYNASGTNYYDEVTIIMLLAQTFADMITDVPEWYIRRDIFDVRSVQYFLDSYGIPYYSEIPLKYQVRIVKNLNKLIMDKSTDVCNQDILDLLELNDAVIYKYFLYKQRRTDASGHYVEEGTLEDRFNLKFIQVKQGDTYDNYIKNNAYLANYDDVTEKDKYWDSVDKHATVKHAILERDFTIEPSKYIAIETTVNYGEYMKEMKYLLGLILDSGFEETFTIPVPSIIEGGEFRPSDLFLLMSMLTGAYASKDLIYEPAPVIRPENMNEEEEYKPAEKTKMTDDEYWMHIRHQEFFERSDERYYGFNSAVNLTEVDNVLKKTYTGFNYQGGKYSLEYFNVENFRLPHQHVKDGVLRCEIKTIPELLDTYERNMEMYSTLTYYIDRVSDNKDDKAAAEYVFYQLFTKEFDYGAYGTATNMEEVLGARSLPLLNFYKTVIADTDIETRREKIKNVLSNIISTLEFYIDSKNFKYLYAFTPLSSFASLLRYAYLLINVFKSYKVQLIDANIAYDINDISDSHEAGIDTIKRKQLIKPEKDRHNVYDCFLMIIKRKVRDLSNRLDNMREYLHIRTPLMYPDDDEYNLDGGRANSTGYESYDGGKAGTGIPYSNINGGSAYLTKDDYWDISGLDLKSIRPESPETEVYDLDGGNIMDVDQEWNTGNTFSNNFNHIIEGGRVRDDTIIDDSYFIRISDFQGRIGTIPIVEVARMQGLDYYDDKTAREITLTEEWRKWRTVDQVLEEFNNSLSLYNINILKNEVRKIKIVDIHTTYEPGIRSIPDIGNVDVPESIVIEY